MSLCCRLWSINGNYPASVISLWFRSSIYFRSSLSCSSFNPDGATEGQRVIHSLHKNLTDIVDFAYQAEMTDLSTFSPALDIRSMQHEQLFYRLFIS